MIGDDAFDLVPFGPFFLFEGRLLNTYILLRAGCICHFSFCLLLVTYAAQSIGCCVLVSFVACWFHLLRAHSLCYTLHLILNLFVALSISFSFHWLLLVPIVVAGSIAGCSFHLSLVPFFFLLNAKTNRYFLIAILKGYEPN